MHEILFEEGRLGIRLITLLGQSTDSCMCSRGFVPWWSDRLGNDNPKKEAQQRNWLPKEARHC